MLRNVLQDKPAQQLLWLLLGLLFGVIIAAGIDLLVYFTWQPAWDWPQQVVAQTLTFLLPGLLVAWIGGGLKGIPNKQSWLAAGLGVAAFLLLVPCMDVITQWNKALPFPRDVLLEEAEAMLEEWLLRPSLGALAGNLLVVALVPAVCEECFFRLGLQRILCRWWGRDWLGVVATALVFSLAHGDMFGLVPRFLMGLILGLLYLQSGSMVVNISAHFANNALIVLLYWLYGRGVLATNLASEGITLPWALTLPLTLAGAALLVVVCRSPKFRNSTPATA